jgi:RecB family exonuclease
MATFEASYAPGIARIAQLLEERPPAPLRRAVVLVPSARHAHAVRRYILVERRRPQDLAGVAFARPAELARDVLARAGRVSLDGWEAVRRLRILKLFEGSELERRLAYFNPTQLRSGQGYADAFARTIGELEASGLDAASCSDVARRLLAQDQSNGKRLADVALVWAAADAERGERATAPMLLDAAARTLTATPGLEESYGPFLALLPSSPLPVLLRFLEALRGCHVVFQEARPLRTDTQRWRRLIGPLAAADVASIPPIPRESTESTLRPPELALVQRYLFELPEVLTDPQRWRSSGADGSVDLEEHATIEDEIEASAVWVAEQVRAGIALEQIALVVPEHQVYAAALRDRLGRLSLPEMQQPPPVHVAGGIAFADTPAGRRFQILLDALLRGLEAEATIRLLPSLRRGNADNELEGRLTPSRAAEIVYGAGITGGSPGDASGAREWMARLSRRRDALRTLVASADAAADARDEPEKRAAVINLQQANRWLRDVEPMLPAIEALQRVGEAVIDGATLRRLWTDVRQLAAAWLRLPPDPPNFLGLFADRLQPVLGDAVADAIAGRAAIRFLMDQLRSEYAPVKRFGEPCVFIGTAAQAAGLPFAAVRLLGLAEGALPRTPHDDPIVPDALRRRVEEIAAEIRPGIVVARLSDRVVDELHDAVRVIGGTSMRLALSAPRQWTDRSDREVSGVMLEVATALGRGARGGEGDVPTSGRLRSAYFVVGRTARAESAAAAPLTPRSLLSSVEKGADAVMRVPVGWLARPSLALDRMHELAGRVDSTELGAVDGLIPHTWAGMRVPGLGDRPLSASGLAILLSCPHRFLLERLLYLSPPPQRPSSDAIDPIAYGSLFHAAFERFMHEAGPALCRREGDLQSWIRRAQAIAAEALEELCHVYPLRGADAVARERDRLLRQIERLVQYEWDKPPREFVAAEMGFGDPDPVRIDLEEGSLYVRGAIDRVDRIGPDALAVRDIKTGRVHDLIDDPVNVGRDLQIGLYTLVLESSDPAAHVHEATYVHPSSVQEQERSFKGVQLDQLRQQTRAWLRTAHAVLTAGAFVRTPNANDCRFCPFVAACGDGVQPRSTRKLAQLPQAHELALFVRLKQERPEEPA